MKKLIFLAAILTSLVVSTKSTFAAGVASATYNGTNQIGSLGYTYDNNYANVWLGSMGTGSVLTLNSSNSTIGVIKFKPYFRNVLDGSNPPAVSVSLDISVHASSGWTSKRTYSGGMGNGSIYVWGLGRTTGVDQVRMTFNSITSPLSYFGMYEVELFTAPDCQITSWPLFGNINSPLSVTANFTAGLSAVSGDSLRANVYTDQFSSFPLWTPSNRTDSDGSFTGTFNWTPTAAGTTNIFCSSQYLSAYGTATCASPNYVNAAPAGVPKFTCGSSTFWKSTTVCNPVAVTGSVSGLSSGQNATITLSPSGLSDTFNYGDPQYSIASVPVGTYTVTASHIDGYTDPPPAENFAVNCTNPTTGPNFTYVSSFTRTSKGIATSQTSISAGEGNISETPVWKLEGYTYNSTSQTNKADYDSIRQAILKNAGVGPTTMPENNATCLSNGVYVLNDYAFFCYNSFSILPTQLSTAASYADTSKKLVIYPTTALGQTYTISSPINLVAGAANNNRRIVALVDGNLTINSNIQIDNTTAGIIFVLKNPGNINLDTAVGRLDGIYLFPGEFNDSATGTSQTQLVGYGSLLGTGESDIGFSRDFSTSNQPAERWFYEPKYLSLFKNVIMTPNYVWKELAPSD